MENESENRNKIQRNKPIVFIQAALIFLMSAAGACSLLPDAGDKFYIIPIVFGWLAVTGAISLVFPKVNPVFFSISVFSASLWAIMTSSFFDLGANSANKVVTGFGFIRMIPSYTDMDIWTRFLLLGGLGIFIMAGHLVLSNLHALQNDYRSLQVSNADRNEIKSVIMNNLSLVLITTFLTVFIVVIIAVILKLIQELFMEAPIDYEWAVLGLGIPAILIIASMLYFIVKRRH